MILLFFVLMSQSFALQLACPSPTLTDASPYNGQTDVPVDAAISLLFDDLCAEMDQQYPFEVRLSTAGEVVETFEVMATFPARSAHVLVQPSSALLADTPYTVEVTGYSIWETRFTTGSEGVAEPTGEVTAAVRFAQWHKIDGERVVDWGVDAQGPADPQELALLHLVVDGQDDRVLATRRVPEDGSSVDLSGSWFASSVDEQCVQVLYRDGAGDIALRSESLCATPKRVGCSSVGALPAALSLFWLPALAVAARRRGALHERTVR